MPHVRKTIRDAVIGLLTGLPTTGARVFSMRDTAAWQLNGNEVPALLIDCIDERVVSQALGGPARRQIREFTLRVRAVVKAGSGYQDALDTIALEIEPVLAAAASLGGAKYAQYSGMQGPQVDASSDQPVAAADYLWTISYAVAANAPDVAQ